MERDIHRLEEIGIEISKQKEKDRDELLAYRALGTREEFAAYKQAESEGDLWYCRARRYMSQHGTQERTAILLVQIY